MSCHVIITSLFLDFTPVFMHPAIEFKLSRCNLSLCATFYRAENQSTANKSVIQYQTINSSYQLRFFMKLSKCGVAVPRLLNVQL